MIVPGVILIVTGIGCFITCRFVGWPRRRSHTLLLGPTLVILGILILTGVIDPNVPSA